MGYVISSDLTTSTEGTKLRIGFGVERADREVFTSDELVTSERAFIYRGSFGMYTFM